MRLLRKGLRIVAAGAITVAIGVSVNQVLNSGKWNLRLVAAVVLAVLSASLDLLLGNRDGDHYLGEAARPVLWSGLAGEDGMPLLLGEVTPWGLGCIRRTAQLSISAE